MKQKIIKFTYLALQTNVNIQIKIVVTTKIIPTMKMETYSKLVCQRFQYKYQPIVLLTNVETKIIMWM